MTPVFFPFERKESSRNRGFAMRLIEPESIEVAGELINGTISSEGARTKSCDCPLYG